MSDKHFHIFFLTALLMGCSWDTAMGQQSSREKIEDIRNAYENLDLPVAEARIEAALLSFDKFTPAELGEIHILSALIHFAKNDREGTRRQLDLALQINPGIKLNIRETPPQVVALFEELVVEKSTASQPTATLRYLVVQDPRPAALVRNMILPGWGQYHMKQHKKGILLMSAWGITSTGAVIAHIKRRQAEDRYLASRNLQEINDRYPTFNNWHKMRNNLFIASAGIWIFSYIDTFIQSPNKNAKNPKHPMQITLVPTPHSPTLTLKYTFQP